MKVFCISALVVSKATLVLPVRFTKEGAEALLAEFNYGDPRTAHPMHFQPMPNGTKYIFLSLYGQVATNHNIG